jgi:hypothetical protein
MRINAHWLICDDEKTRPSKPIPMQGLKKMSPKEVLGAKTRANLEWRFNQRLNRVL